MDKPSDARLLKDYRRLIEIARDLASTLDLDPLLHRIINAAKDIAGADAASNSALRFHFTPASFPGGDQHGRADDPRLDCSP